ncbi:hypothetical protein A4H97_10480 [Niastella yeongjuensis]|uniref:Uncharacterized protein n=1 Tax=Niastella yeongjuensis TaxID=354355 RepID=A0A1V9EF63_9BACT|nr:hypothetical protein [Niastella yeongjuensis]OQP44779.1 hypothetical protein A4H97_10480 [Niastella yeongjuensis]SEP42475.1 hypothetical protein SAMN05660816_06004 [Niastella yeongjuensis]
MMKKLICVLLFGVELLACKQAPDKKPVIIPTDYIIQHTTASADSVKQYGDTAVIASPSGLTITPLPFGPAGSTAKNFYKKDPWFYYRLIGEGYTLSHDYFTKYTPAYPLPPIEKYSHSFDNEGRDYCLDSGRQVSVDSLFTIKHYRVRLPDHERFEVYYTTGDAAVDTLFPQKYSECEMNYKLYGYLIFYERTTKTAHLLPAFYHWYGESDHSRSFYIDSNYHIFTYEEWMYEGDNGAADIDVGPVNEITINSKGVFTIKTIKKQRPL